MGNVMPCFILKSETENKHRYHATIWKTIDSRPPLTGCVFFFLVAEWFALDDDVEKIQGKKEIKTVNLSDFIIL